MRIASAGVATSSARPRAVLRVDGDAHRRRQLQFHSRCGRPPQRRPAVRRRPRPAPHRVGALRAAANSSPPRRAATGAGRPAPISRGASREHAVTLGVAAGVVDRAEVVQVDVQQASARRAAVAARTRLSSARLEARARQQPGHDRWPRTRPCGWSRPRATRRPVPARRCRQYIRPAPAQHDEHHGDDERPAQRTCGLGRGTACLRRDPWHLPIGRRAAKLEPARLRPTTFTGQRRAPRARPAWVQCSSSGCCASAVKPAMYSSIASSSGPCSTSACTPCLKLSATAPSMKISLRANLSTIS